MKKFLALLCIALVAYAVYAATTIHQCDQLIVTTITAPNGGTLTIDGSHTTNLNADNIASGTLANARLDSDLQIYAGITPSANVQTLLGAANYSAFRTSLGVAIGSDVQAYDADFASLAAGITGLVKGAGNGGGYSAATASSDYIGATTGSAIQKASSGGLTAATFSDVLALTPSYIVTNNNANVLVLSNALRLDAAHALSLSNATAGKVAVIGADNTVTNSSLGAVPINGDTTATTFPQLLTLTPGGLIVTNNFTPNLNLNGTSNAVSGVLTIGSIVFSNGVLATVSAITNTGNIQTATLNTTGAMTVKGAFTLDRTLAGGFTIQNGGTLLVTVSASGITGSDSRLRVWNAANSGTLDIYGSGSFDTTSSYAWFVGGSSKMTLSSGGALALGRTSASVFVGGTLKTDTTTTGNVGGGTDTLITYTIPASVLGANGEALEFDVWGSFAGNANTKDLTVNYGGTTLIDTTALVFNGVSWRAHGRIVRTGAATQTATTELTIGGTLLSAVNSTICSTTSPTETLSGTVVFKCTGTDSGVTPADNNIVQNGMTLKWMPNGN